MSASKTTEFLISKCFYMYPRDGNKIAQKYTVHFHTVTYKEGALKLARAARRFVKAEQAEKMSKCYKCYWWDGSRVLCNRIKPCSKLNQFFKPRRGNKQKMSNQELYDTVSYEPTGNNKRPNRAK